MALIPDENVTKPNVEDGIDLNEAVEDGVGPGCIPPPRRTASTNRNLSRHYTGVGVFDEWKLERDETVFMGHEDTLSRLENASYRLKLKAWTIAEEAGQARRWHEIQCAEQDAAQVYLRLCELDLQQAQELAAQASRPPPPSFLPKTTTKPGSSSNCNLEMIRHRFM